MTDENHTEAELALKKRRENTENVNPDIALDEADIELLDQNKVERDLILSEITELRERSEQRKKEREEEEQRLAAERAAEDARRKAEEEERRRRKQEDEESRRSQRAQKMAEFEKWKQPPKANFVISKKSENSLGAEPDVEQDDGKHKKSKEQLEAEKHLALSQRIKPLDIQNFDDHKMSDKAKELHHSINKLVGENYDLEKKYKVMQVQLMELAERAREAKGVGKDGVKRIVGGEESVDFIQTRFAGAPSKVEMFSKYERMKDKRSYVEKHVLFTGPQYALPAERIKPTKAIAWDEEGIPIYTNSDAAHAE